MKKNNYNGHLFRRIFAVLVCCILSASMLHAQMPGTIYRIVSTNSGKAMTVNGNHDNDAPIVMGTLSADDKDQMWALISDGSPDTYGLMNVGSRRSIDMAPSNEGKLLQWTTSLDNVNQLFKFKSPGIAGSAMQLLNASDPSMAVTENADGTLQMLSDLTNSDTYFELTEVVGANENPIPLPYSTYHISPLNGEGVLSNGGSNENDALIVLEQPDEESYGQMWKVVVPAYTNTTEVMYQLSNVISGKCIDCAMESAAQKPLQWTKSDDERNANWNQMFEFVEVANVENAYQLKITFRSADYYMAVNSENELYMTQDAASAETYFKFTRIAGTNLPKGVYWQDERIFEENKEPGHATYIPYQSTAAMRADASYDKPWLDPTSSNKWLSLNGTWKLQWHVLDSDYTMPEKEFYGDSVDASSWSEVTVPGCLEMQGYGKPLYINVAYAFNDNPPYITMLNGLDNSVGSYRRDFTLPEGWENERVLLHFDGVYACAYVWVNGHYVGYSEGANHDAEFDVSKYVRTGENNVSVRVIRWTDGSYLEGQDMWHMSGIHRDVYLMAVPRVFVRDHYLRTELSNDATSGSLFVDLDLDNRDSIATEKSYEVRLLSPEGNVMATREATASFSSAEASKQISLEFESLAGLKPWTADSPTLYTVEVVQKNADGDEESVISTKLGFCKAYIEDSRFLVNGKRTLMRGVNTQDTHPLTGRTMSIENMWEDLVLMKQNNVNCVRTSHYPRSPKMNAMMDYLGLYMMDEADVEWHKNWSDGGSIERAPSWRAAIVDRVVRMVLRDRNHVSVVCWSLGNESGGGINHQHSYNAARALDARPIHYEGATAAGTSPTDIYSVMYRPQPEVARLVDNRGKPYFMCEYAHAMGHSVGNLKEYWETMENSTNGMGGCIWDWVDQAIVSYSDIQNGELKVNGFNKYRNGHDYPEAPHQGNFVNNGIITADRAATGKLAEVKRVYQQINLSHKSVVTKKVTVFNNYESINLEGMTLNWELLLDGSEVQDGSLTLPSIASQTSADITIPYTMNSNGEYLLNVSVALSEPTLWAEAGHTIAAAQFMLRERPAMAAVDNSSASPLTLTTNGSNYIISGENISMTVNSTYGITKWQQGGMDIIPQNAQGVTAPAYSNYRWIENDAPYGTDPAYGASNGISTRTFSVKKAADGTVLIKENATGRNCNYAFTYTVHPSGVVELDADYTAMISNLRRIGMLMQFNPDFSMTQYYARGPLDNTIDRKQGADLGIYTLPVRDFHVDYVRPQTSGDRQDLRWIILCNGEGNGVRVEAEGQVNITVDNYTDEFKHDYLHQWELPVSNDVYVNFDHAQLGIGNASCGAGVLDEYKLPSSGTYSYRLRFTAVKDVETGIPSLPSLDAVIGNGAPAPVYNLRGQLVGTTARPDAFPSGIYVVRGKKFMVK